MSYLTLPVFMIDTFPQHCYFFEKASLCNAEAAGRETLNKANLSVPCLRVIAEYHTIRRAKRNTLRGKKNGVV